MIPVEVHAEALALPRHGVWCDRCALACAVEWQFVTFPPLVRHTHVVCPECGRHVYEPHRVPAQDTS